MTCHAITVQQASLQSYTIKLPLVTSDIAALRPVRPMLDACKLIDTGADVMHLLAAGHG